MSKLWQILAKFLVAAGSPAVGVALRRSPLDAILCENDYAVPPLVFLPALGITSASRIRLRYGQERERINIFQTPVACHVR